jgi:hypothetical protein
MSQTTVLIGFAEAQSSPEVVWSLVDGGFRVVAFARRGRSSAIRHSRHVVCHEICPPEVDLQASLTELQALLSSVGAEAMGARCVLFPLDDKAVWLSNNVKLEQGWLLAGVSGANAELALHKCLQIQRAQEAGFKVPKTQLARTAKEVREFAEAESFPIFMKPAECVPVRQGRVHICRKFVCVNSRELDRALAEWKESVPLLVQPFIAGTGEGVFGLASSEGVRAWSAHRRLRMMNPQGSGSSASISQPVQEELKAKAEAFIQASNWRGLFMIEFLRDSAGTPWFVECNGRPWGSMSLSRRQGLEYPAWQVELAMDPESQVGMAASSDPGLVCRHVGKEFLHLLFVLRGPKSKALSNWPSFWSAAGEVFRIHGKDKIYNWRSEDPKVFLADFCCTIRDNVFKSRN